MSNLLNEKDNQIEELRAFLNSKGKTLGDHLSTRINHLEEQLQIKSNDFYRLQDEKIKQEHTLQSEINKLSNQNLLLVFLMLNQI